MFRGALQTMLIGLLALHLCAAAWAKPPQQPRAVDSWQTRLAAELFLAQIAPGSTAAGPSPAEDDPSGDATEPAGERLPPPLTEYRGRAIAPTMSYHGAPWLIRANREDEERGDEMLAALGVRPGQSVTDFGCGNGYHTLKLAQMVGDQGGVWAVDIQQEMLHLLAERAEAEGVSHIHSVLCTPVDPKLPPDSQDLILLVDVYHELSYPEQVLAGLRAALKPTGRLVLVEFRGENPFVPIKPEHKMTKAQVLCELLPNGFRLVEEYDKLPWQHILFFQRGEPTEYEPADDTAQPDGDG